MKSEDKLKNQLLFKLKMRGQMMRMVNSFKYILGEMSTIILSIMTLIVMTRLRKTFFNMNFMKN